MALIKYCYQELRKRKDKRKYVNEGFELYRES